MDGATTECAAFDETVVFLSHFKDLRDPRQQGKVSYPLYKILLLCLLTFMARAQVKVAEKSNEIIAIPKLLDMLAIEGAIVTIDAMGCQRAIAKQIIDKKADYLLALKGNQGSLRADVEVFAAEQKARNFADTRISQDTTIDGDHGRIETRTTTVIHDVDWLQARHDWPSLNAVVM